MFMYISEALEDFLESLEVEGGRAKKTIENYRLYIERLVEFTDDIPVSKIDSETVRKYRLWLNRYENFDGKGLGRATQTYHLIALRRFLTYLSRRDIKSLEPSKIELPKVVKPQVSFLHYEEIERMLAEIKTDDEAGLRDRAIVELLFSSGLRVSELCSLDRDHINTKRREFMVRGKGNKDRPIFISKSAAEHIDNYLNARQDNLAPLFINYSRRYKKPSTDGNYRRITPRSIQRMIDKYARMAGVTKNVTPHTMRHSFATDLLVNGADLRSVQGMLGHSSIITTQIYTHVTDQHLKEIHEKFHSETE